MKDEYRISLDGLHQLKYAMMDMSRDIENIKRDFDIVVELLSEEIRYISNKEEVKDNGDMA